MSKVDFHALFSRHKHKAEEVKRTLSYILRLPDETFPEYSSDQDPSDEDVLRVMPPNTSPKPAIQPLSLPEKKYLYDFWVKQWEVFKAAPACQNVSEKRLLEKFDSYIPINIRRYLVKNWNNTFAGGYVSGEPEVRQEREVEDLRALTKSWSWLCKELGFKPWPLTIDHENENLENVKIDVRSKPFNLKSINKSKEIEDWSTTKSRPIPMQTGPENLPIQRSKYVHEAPRASENQIFERDFA